MVKAKDFALDEDNDLKIVNGDFVVEFSDNTHIEHLIASYKGFYKEFPVVGVGIEQYLKTVGTAGEIKRLVALELEADKYLVDEVKVSTSPVFELNVTANRIS